MRQEEGRPVPALLLLFSMFAFASVFHVMTRTEAPIAATFNTQVAALAAQVSAARLSSAPPAPPALPASPGSPASLVSPASAPPASLASPVALASPALEAAAWPIVEANVTSEIVPSSPAPLKNGNGAVTRAFSQTGSALRGAFRKAF